MGPQFSVVRTDKKRDLILNKLISIYTFIYYLLRNWFDPNSHINHNFYATCDFYVTEKFSTKLDRPKFYWLLIFIPPKDWEI